MLVSATASQIKKGYNLVMEQGDAMECKHSNSKLTISVNPDGRTTTRTHICKDCGMDVPESKYDDPKYEGIPHLGSGTAPTRRQAAEAIEAREKRWEKDMPAYKALRAQGLQPPRIDGSAELMANAETRFEVESGKIMKGKAKEIESTISTLESVTGKSIYQPNTTPVNL